jgi:ParB/RepB/Spo0J family partition protein
MKTARRDSTPEPDSAGVLASGIPTAAEAPGAEDTQFCHATPLMNLRESAQNPRQRFEAAAMAELERSIREKGVLTPILVRPGTGGGYEIASGHRRFRAAQAAGLATVPVLIRRMTDAEFLEVLVIENDQREDVHALEEASGYQALLQLKGYDVAKIAARVGRSPKYVYDRLKLLQLVPAARKLFLEDRFTAGHAILLARLKPADQFRAIELDTEYGCEARDNLFVRARSLPFTDEEAERLEKKDPYALVKPASVREFEAWIQRNVKFDRDSVDPMLFPETAEVLAEPDATKVILITREYLASSEVRAAAKGERIFGEQAWKRADGEEGSKTCAHARVGLVACGPGQGQAFRICTSKEKCTTHWSAWQKERKKQQAAKTSGGAVEAQRRQREQYERERQKVEAEAARWKKGLPAILEALAVSVKKAPLKPSGRLVQTLLQSAQSRKWQVEMMPPGDTVEDLVRHLAFCELSRSADDIWVGARKEFAGKLRAFGIVAGDILDKVAPAEPLQTSAKSAGKKKARR